MRDYERRMKALPKEHKPAPYAVQVTRKGVLIDTKYVRASSPERAVIAGVYWNNLISKHKADSGSPTLLMPAKTEPNQTGSLIL